jgi:Terminase large subunit, T4likevirus-type, N-terminal/Anti-CBASS protein Acb1-like
MAGGSAATDVRQTFNIRIGPQPGPQTQFLSSPADIAIYGGAAGGGKTFAELLEPLRHVSNKDFGAVIFRRTTPQITNEGGLWDESGKLYPMLGAKPNQTDLSWTFPSGATVSFKHLEHEKTVLNWQGSQVPLLCFDELTHFSQKQFWYMLSRNRSMCGVRPYVRATCNPDADSWVAELIAWWINQDTGYPIPERAGVLRWFVRIGDSIIWADRPEDLAEYTAPNEHGEQVPISPAGLNASSEGEIETFDDSINAYQEAFFRPNLTRVLRFVQLSLWGVVDPAITFAFVPLSDLTPKEKAEVDKIEAETDDIRINGGVLDPAEVRKTVANNPDSRYPGIDPDGVPDLLSEEEQGFEPKGAAAGIAKEANGEEPDGNRDQDDDDRTEPQREAA